MKKKGDFERGRIETVILKRPFTFNGNLIKAAIIEIDHINFGLDRKTAKLRTKPRSHFTVPQVVKFLELLKDEDLYPTLHRKRYSRFEHRVDCPVPGRFFGRQFFMVFETNYDRPEEIRSITLFLKE